jgi:hypothetical protein
MRQLHILRQPGDQLALEVVARQVADGDEVRVVLLQGAAETRVPEGAQGLAMPPLQYDELVDLLSWSERVVTW